MAPVNGAQHKYLLYTVAAAIRILLAGTFPSLPDFLSSRVEVATPVTSFRRLQEGVFLYNHGVSPYDGGIFHQAPLLLPVFSAISSLAGSTFATVVLYTIVDILSAESLVLIASSAASVQSSTFSSSRKGRQWPPLAVAASYLLNPLTILTCLGRPTSVLTNCLCLFAVAKACSGAAISSVFALSVAGYASLHPGLLVFPVMHLCYDRIMVLPSGKKPPSLLQFATRYGIAFAGFTLALLGLSFLLLQDWSFMASVYGTRLLLPDLTPNVGLWWYFFIEMFDSFRAFFLGVFWLHMVSYAPTLTIRLHRQPLAAVVLMYGVFAVFQPYANIGDAGVFIALLGLYSHVFELTRYTFPAVSALLYSMLLGPAFYHLWIYAGSGNANFFYAITLVWSLGLVVVLADVLYAVLRDEWEAERPEMKGKEARQI